MIKYIEYYHTIDSTIDLAEKYIKEQKYDDHFLIRADIQTNARGRKGNEWDSGLDGLWFNIGLNHISKQKSFTIFIGICILNSLIELTHCQEFKIKWPNDIYLYDKKICGIICSQFIQYHKINIGIGINTNNDKPPIKKADSIKNLLNLELKNDVYLHMILKTIFNTIGDFEKFGIDMFADLYKKYDYLVNQKIKVTSGKETLEGYYKGINSDGELLIKDCKNITQIINSGEIIIL